MRDDMQFLVIGRDGTDENAPDRRMAVREDHLALAVKMLECGRWLYAAAILNESGQMTGSVIICDFPSREALQKEWLDREPYITGNVWQTVEISRARVPAFLKKGDGE